MKAEKFEGSMVSAGLVPAFRAGLRALLRREHGSGLLTYASPRLLELGIPHGFTTRRKGASDTSWDMGKVDPLMCARLMHDLGLASTTGLLSTRQVHGAEIATVHPASGTLQLACADGLIARSPGQALLIYTADCVPVLLARRDRSAVAAVHAGWRGLVAGVIPRAVHELGPGECIAAIGPCLSPARFEVGQDVIKPFRAADLAGTIQRKAGKKAHIDLRQAAYLQLERLGIREIDVSDRCTYDDPELWSFRRDVTHAGAPSTGRLGAVIALPEEPLAASAFPMEQASTELES